MERHIDDRVRAISLAMGMVPIIWTSTPASGPFDTNGMSAIAPRGVTEGIQLCLIDWRVAGGLVNSTISFNAFEAILGNASSLNTGYVWIGGQNLPCLT